MADFVAVLRKTIGSLGDNTPAMREKVFDKARATIEAKLQAINPPPPAAVIDRQRKALEDAIATVRADYAEPPAKQSEAEDMLESMFATLDQPAASSVPPARVPSPDIAAVTSAPAAPPAPEVATFAPPRQEETPEAVERATGAPDAPAAERLEAAFAAPRRAAPARSQRGSRKGLVAALVVVLLAAGGGYIWWSGGADTPPSTAQVPAGGESAPAQEEAAETVEDLVDADAEPQEAAASTQEAAEPAAPPSAASASPEKLTQRLLPDGSEVDEGPAGGGAGIGEGSSVATAALSDPAPTPDEAQPEAPADAQAAAEPQEQESPAAPAAQPAAVAVGQRAIFYEERTSSAEGSAEMGSIAWSLVQESPGGDLPPEPAIRAEATIPGKDVQLRMTIRRNGDQTLPASHIVEMIFLTPDGFDGGGVSNVSRIAFKETEQAPGSPLIGIPAKIADGFFLIALSDATAETQANLTLLRRQSWIDIPIVYQSGQRALLSLEKGIPGDRVFQDALNAWSDADSG